MQGSSSDLRLGIGITTLNRREMVCAQVAAIRRLTGGAFDLVICDDGSSDGTTEALRAMGEIVVAGVNRGVAWNKNRCIFYLMAVRGCDAVILLDDDMLPEAQDWQMRWVQAAFLLGHVNFTFSAVADGRADVDCTPDNPRLTKTLLGCAMSFHRFAWSMVGYFDARFGRYGHEHTEYTNRFLANGFGGEQREVGSGMDRLYYVIGGGIRLIPARHIGSPEEINALVRANTEIWAQIEREGGQNYRAPWMDSAQKLDFLAEMRLTLRHHHIAIPRQSVDFFSF